MSEFNSPSSPLPGAAPHEPQPLWFVFRGSEILVAQGPSGLRLPETTDLGEIALTALSTYHIGRYSERPCFALEIESGAALPRGSKLTGLRSLFAAVEEPLAALAGRAFQIKEWHRNSRFCGRCGTPTDVRASEHARSCPQCAYTIYPPVSPAVMVLVTRGRELLLARRPGTEPGRYSAVAGFVEPGEMLEDTVRRETLEEVGVEIKDIRYFGSQPWPFPHSLMVAFTASHAAGAVRPDGVEIEDARWFDAGALPKLPPAISISRRLIETIAAKLDAEER
jgi:NAD+ diphosphatase